MERTIRLLHQKRKALVALDTKKKSLPEWAGCGKGSMVEQSHFTTGMASMLVKNRKAH